MQFLELFASVHSSVMESGVVRIGLKTILTEILGDLSSDAAIFEESAATCLSVAGP
jgi:hypothetical protein